LARARKARGLSQTELADKAGLKQSDVSKLETGKMLKTTGMARLSRALRVPDLWLELGEGPEPNFHGVEEPVPQYEGRPMSLAEAAGEFGSMTVSRYDRELLDDFAELLPEDQARIRGEIAERATQMRKHAEYVLKKAGVTAPAPAHRVSHIPSAPAPNPTRVQSPLKTFATKKHRDVK
jgi:transcriptional regulator with XRE-family HTH domain